MKTITALALYWLALIGLILALPGNLLQWAAWWCFFLVTGEDEARRALKFQIAIDIPPTPGLHHPITTQIEPK